MGAAAGDEAVAEKAAKAQGGEMREYSAMDLDPRQPGFPEYWRLADLAEMLMLFETDAAFARLAKEVMGIMMMDPPGDTGRQAIRGIGVLQIGYVAGIEAYEREHPVETKGEGR